MGSNSHKTTAAVIPVYNVQEYLDRCLRTVLAQTVAFDEIILVDDGSTDDSGLICDSYSEKYSYVSVIHTENHGLSAARNTGIALSTARYITFIDSDDWVSVDYLRTLLNSIEECDADMAMCGMRRTDTFDEAWKNNHQTTSTEVYTGEQFMRVMLRLDGNRTVHYAWGKLYKRELLSDDHFPVGILNEDVESGFKAILHAKSVVETDAPLYYYYRNEKSITGSRFGENYLNLTDVWKSVYELAKREAPQWGESVRFNLMRADFTILCDSLIHGDIETDKKYESEINEHLDSLRRNLPSLLRSPIALNRRILIVLVSAFYRPALKCARIIKRNPNYAKSISVQPQPKDEFRNSRKAPMISKEP